MNIISFMFLSLSQLDEYLLLEQNTGNTHPECQVKERYYQGADVCLIDPRVKDMILNEAPHVSPAAIVIEFNIVHQ